MAKSLQAAYPDQPFTFQNFTEARAQALLAAMAIPQQIPTSTVKEWHSCQKAGMTRNDRAFIV